MTEEEEGEGEEGEGKRKRKKKKKPHVSIKQYSRVSGMNHNNASAVT